MGAPFNEQLALSASSEQGYEQGLQDESGAARGSGREVVAAALDRLGMESERLGAQLSSLCRRSADLARSPHRGQMLVKKSGSASTTPDALDVERLSRDHRGAQSRSQYLTSALAHGTIDRDHL